MKNILEKIFGLHYILALVAIIAIIVILSKKKETFVSEFLDRSNEKKTSMTRASSYAQETNHFRPTPTEPEPISGMETPFRVNMFNAYIQ